MNSARQSKLIQLVGLVSLVSLIVLLVAYALRQNINLFFTPSELVAGIAPDNRMIRLGGMVVKGSVVRKPGDLCLHFQLTDYQEKVGVTTCKPLPDLFREGQGIVVLGMSVGDSEIKAEEVLAKHDENYMPPEVKKSLEGKPHVA